jgi:hypothetical protein
VTEETNRERESPKNSTFFKSSSKQGEEERERRSQGQGLWFGNAKPRWWSTTKEIDAPFISPFCHTLFPAPCFNSFPCVCLQLKVSSSIQTQGIDNLLSPTEKTNKNNFSQK